MSVYSPPGSQGSVCGERTWPQKQSRCLQLLKRPSRIGRNRPLWQFPSSTSKKSRDATVRSFPGRPLAKYRTVATRKVGVGSGLIFEHGESLFNGLQVALCWGLSEPSSAMPSGT